MVFFWTVWAAAVLTILVLATVIEFNGGRKGFEGANGIFLFASAYLTVLSSPILLIVTWIWSDFWTAAEVYLIGAVAYATLFALALRLMGSIGRART
ncbi:hypothetical protein ACI48D_20040 [Massilia sp. LXY-6]|uniref:hypothetical protein n=1 Tax=Massilia sp. LXY-6 TaxID=3379823 RepID=UPI003EE2B2B9